MRISDWSSDVCSSDLLTDRLTLHPDWPLDTKVLAAAVRDVIEDQCGPRRYRAVDDLLSGAAPRLNGIDGDILCGGEPVAGAIAAAHAMDQRSEAHTSELQSLIRKSYAVLRLKQKTNHIA